MNGKEYIGDRYKIIRTLGQGGMSKVYLVENIKLGTLWAIKEIRKNNDLKIDFLAEPNILKKLSHPALPRIFDILEDEDTISIIVDYIEGETLDQLLQESKTFPETTVLDWARQLCAVLLYLHEYKPNPIIYRDMKPSNIILTKTGELKVIDFGIAREYKRSAENDTVYIGTRGYAAPEQYGSGQTTVTTDIYSLGITLYQLATGKSPNEAPYEIKPVRFFNKKFSKHFERIIEKCTRQNPSERYQSVRELMEELDGVEDDLNVSNDIICNNSKTDMIDVKPFKKLVLCIWDNYEFGCELAYCAAKTSGYNVLLVDLDLLAPKADLCLNTRKFPQRIISEGELLKSGVDITIDAVEKNYLTHDLFEEASLKRKDLKNLSILTGNYRIENYEYFNDSSLVKLIEKAYICFDLTILLVNKSIYDSYTVISLSKSDLNIVSINADLDKVREFNSYIAFLNEKQQIPMGKTKFVAFEYNSSTNLGLNVLKEATQNNYIGKVSFSKKRKVYRNLKLAYAARMEKEIANEYITILRCLNILPVTSAFYKFVESLKNLLRIRRLS